MENFLKDRIRTIRDWPKPGVNFRDVAPLFSDPLILQAVVHRLAAAMAPFSATHIAALDARGFILGGALSVLTQKSLVLVRKKGKLPGDTFSLRYESEYGVSELEVQRDALKKGDRVFLVDDLIATGGTLVATSKLVMLSGAAVVGVGAVVDLPELGGSSFIRGSGIPVTSLTYFSESE